MAAQSGDAASRGVFNVIEINPYAPRPHAFTEAAICVRDAIRAAGYTSEVYANEAVPGERSIVIGAVPPRLQAVDALDPYKTVIYNFEQMGTASYNAANEYIPWLRNWVVADYHSRNIEWLRGSGHTWPPILELPLVPSPSVAYRPDLTDPPSVDVVFFGTPNPRREALVERLRAAGLSVESVAGAFGEELTPAIKRARIVLHVHFYETALFPIARFLQPIEQGVPIVCESSVFSELADWSQSRIVFAPYDGLADACRKLLANEAERAERAARNRAFAASIDFRAPFERLVAALESMRHAEPAAPVQPRAPSAGPSEEGQLTREEIEAILAEEADAMPPEPGAEPPPFKIVERQPGKGPMGVWVVILLLIFSFYTIWLTMPGRK